MTEDCTIVWNNCLQIIRNYVGEQSFTTWFKPLQPLHIRNGVLTVQVPSQFFYEWIEEHYVHILKKAITSELGNTGKLAYSMSVSKPAIEKETNSGEQPKRPIPPAASNTIRPEIFRTGQQENLLKNTSISTPNRGLASVMMPMTLKQSYNFETFVEGECNRLARTAGMAISENPGTTSFNPLFLHSPIGLGKTHLAQAIGNEINKRNAKKKVQYVSSDAFMTQFVEALKNRCIQDFTSFYMDLDVLIIDDVQFLAGKEKTQESLFHIFNHLHQANKQIVLTSDCAPKNMVGVQERLLSRFKWGLTAEMGLPDYQTRLTIIHNRMQNEGIFISQQVAEFLALNVDTNIRELHGVLVSLIAKSSLMRQEIDLTMAKMVVETALKTAVQKEVNLEYIQQGILNHFQINANELKSKSRKKNIANARQIAMFLSQQYTTLSGKIISNYFGGTDHSTVTHAVKSIQQKVRSDQDFKTLVEELKTKMKLA
ncbi:MAG: chromosomal replication initiator protein DnaA [Bacteroidetes bacterium]|nr:MAG: chromosomal replication initiator protein DnaA [Bacteroidota bacterium]